jgi:hypothetical protein
LTIDDNATNRHIMALQAAKWGMAVRKTEVPAKALSWLQAGARFDLVILDMHMTEMQAMFWPRLSATTMLICRWFCSAPLDAARRKATGFVCGISRQAAATEPVI